MLAATDIYLNYIEGKDILNFYVKYLKVLNYFSECVTNYLLRTII